MEALETRSEERPYWEDLSYDVAKTFAKNNQQYGQRSVIAFGYFLRYIRDNKMYVADGYRNFGEYARAEHGISESTASRNISRMERFSEGGNSPKLAEKYQDYTPSKLQEMITMTDEQLGQVTPDMTVKEIREIRKPELQPDPEPVQTCIDAGSQESESVTVNVTEELPALPEEDPTPAGPVIIEGNLEELLPGGADVWAVRQKEAAACVHKKDGICEVLSDAEVQQPCVEGPCPEETQEPHDERWFALQIYEKSSYGKQAARICAEASMETWTTIGARIQRSIAPYGGAGECVGDLDIRFYGLSNGITCKIGEEKCHLTYTGLARELKQLIVDGVIVLEEPKEPGEEEKFATSQENAENEPEIEDDLPETEQASAEPDQEAAQPVKIYDAGILQKLIDDVEGKLNQMADYWREELPNILTKHLMMLEAYELLKQQHEKEMEREAAELAPDRTFLLGILHSGLVGELQSKDWKGALNTARNLVEVLEGICEEDAKNEPIDAKR